jgi:hypothetical protein
MVQTLDNINKLSLVSGLESYFEIHDSKLRPRRIDTGKDNVLDTVTITPTAPAVFNDSAAAVDWDVTTAGIISVPASSDPQEFILEIGSAKIIKKLVLMLYLPPGETLGNIQILGSPDGVSYPYRLYNAIPESSTIVWNAQQPEGFEFTHFKIITSGTDVDPLATTILEIQAYESLYPEYHIYEATSVERFLYAQLKTPFRVTGPLTAFNVVEDLPGQGDEIRYQLGIDDVWYGIISGWTAVSNQQSNWLNECSGEGDIGASIGSFPLTAGVTKNVYVRALFGVYDATAGRTATASLGSVEVLGT